MRRAIVLGGLLFLGLILGLNAEIFEFKYRKDDKYKIITEVQEKIYLNGQLSHRAEFLNKISIHIRDTKGKSGFLAGDFLVSERAWGQNIYKSEEEAYTAEFWRDERGVYTIDDTYLFPIVRNVPTFPVYNLDFGQIWKEKGTEIHDLRPYGIEKPLAVSIDVYYTYLRNEVIAGVTVAVFMVEYSSTTSLDLIPTSGTMVPVKIKGTSQQLYYWDIARGRPYQYQDQFDFIYILSTGDVVEFEGTSRGRVLVSEELDKAQVTEDIKKDIEREKLKDVTVKKDEEGITITLENIQFMPDSAELMDAEKSKLDKIAEILKKYPDRDLVVVGHTAYAGVDYGLKELSEQRAKAVADYLLSLGVRDPSRIIYMGKGPTEPIADNNTEEGRRKNRRVEIKILEN